MIERICEVCGKTFPVEPHTVVEGKGRFCGRICGGKARQHSVAERLEAMTSKASTPEGCDEFTGYLLKGRYGWLDDGHGHPKQAHIWAWELAHGPVSKGMDVHHKCRNPRCVKEAHLELQPHDEHSQGENNASAKLTTSQAQEIRGSPPESRSAIKALATRLGVCPLTIRNILARTSWAWLK